MAHHTLVRAAFSCFGLLLLMLAGCWGSKFTLIAPAQAKVDIAYVGDWDAVNSAGDHSEMIIRNIDNHLYYIELHEKKDAAKVEHYVGFIAEARGATFAHVQPMQDNGSVPDEWIIVRVQLANGKLTLRQLSEDFFKNRPINSAQDLRQALEQNVDNEAMYAKDETITATKIAR